MSHLQERVLDKLVSGTAAPTDVQRILRHVEGCRACARKLEEWRDNFAEVDEHFPELALEMAPIATITPGGLVLMPQEEEPRPRFEIDLSTLLWIGAVLLALVVGYGASRLRQSSEGMIAAKVPSGEAESVRGSAPATGGRGNTAPAADPARITRSTTTPTPPRLIPEPTPGSTATTPPPRSTIATADTTPSRTAASPRFKTVSRGEAIRRLGGPVRSLQGFTSDHIEAGSASAVPGAQTGLDVVRVVYRTADGGRVLLDQQLIPTDSSGFRPIDDPTLENGETAYGTSPTGVSVATWLDEDGYRLSLVAQLPLDSLKQLVPLVR